MNKKATKTMVLLTALSLAVVVAALFFLPDTVPLHFGPTGAGTVASKFLLLLFVPVPAAIYAAARSTSKGGR